MAETEDTLAEYLRLTAALHDAQTGSTEWLTASPDTSVSSDLDRVAWQPFPHRGEQGPGRWVWAYRASQESGSRPTVRGRLRPGRARVLIVGNGLLGDRLLAELTRHSSYQVVGRVCRRIGGEAALDDHERERYDPLEQLDKIAMRDAIDCVVVAASDGRGDLPMHQLLACRFRGIRVEDGVTFYERVCRKVPLDGLRPSHFLFHGGFRWPSR